MVACAVRWLSAAAVASLALLWRRIRPIVRLSVHALQERSHELYAAKRFDEALEAAAAARDLARNELGEESSTHQRMIFHLAAVLAAMRRHEETGALLSECEVLACRMHGDSSLALVPICHARAELHEAAGDYALAIAALERARDLRHDSLGSAHPDYARSCFNLAGLLLRHANEVLVMSDRQRAVLAGRAVDSGLEAAAVSADAEQAKEFVQALLELILYGGWPNRLKELPDCKGAIGRLESWLAERNFPLPSDPALCESSDDGLEVSDSESVSEAGGEAEGER
mmetsp:Transcript_8078/g.25928  ORF Transcript_8078/g.25928 Transcript_8078/m.25928 type:complete len:285 (+) Transcript_8078:104-958(+)